MDRTASITNTVSASRYDYANWNHADIINAVRL
jgi:hypothetical protein